LEFSFDKIEYAEVDPTPKSPINREPFAEFFGKGTPSATVFRHVL
jgi:hypothetical protein